VISRWSGSFFIFAIIVVVVVAFVAWFLSILFRWAARKRRARGDVDGW
jgi:hypothetical protein